ncbi:hypothetical protein BGZ94_008651 [Podila epigama]|nr:hypothetical protein BGZ94_008651 [Podila epigama]
MIPLTCPVPNTHTQLQPGECLERRSDQAGHLRQHQLQQQQHQHQQQQRQSLYNIHDSLYVSSTHQSQGPIPSDNSRNISVSNRFFRADVASTVNTTTTPAADTNCLTNVSETVYNSNNVNNQLCNRSNDNSNIFDRQKSADNQCLSSVNRKRSFTQLENGYHSISTGQSKDNVAAVDNATVDTVETSFPCPRLQAQQLSLPRWPLRHESAVASEAAPVPAPGAALTGTQQCPPYPNDLKANFVDCLVGEWG